MAEDLYGRHMCILIVLLMITVTYRGLGIGMKGFLLRYCPLSIQIDADGEQSQEPLARLMPQITDLHPVRVCVCVCINMVPLHIVTAWM